MRRTSPSLLNDIVVAADLIIANTADRTLEDYLGDAWFRSAVERNLTVIGEAIRKLERRDPSVANAIPEFRDIIDFRNRIVHGYYTLDHRRVWRYTKENLPPLREAVAMLLRARCKT